jgi:hypothetical protein
VSKNRWNLFEVANPSLAKLAGLASRDQLRGSWLLHAPRGFGKHALVNELVKLAHPGASDLDSDLIVLDGATGVEEMREALKSLSYTPSVSASKILVIENAEALNTYAANALLKTLEEPPAYALIVLTASDSNKVLPTILSRCFRLRVTVLPELILSQWLNENYELEEKVVATILKEAAGRLGVAERLANDPDLISELTGLRTRLLAVVDADFATQLQWVNSLSARDKLVGELEVLIQVLKEDMETGNLKRRHQLRIFDHSLQLIKKFINPKLVLTYSFLRLGSLAGMMNGQ